MTSQRDCPTQQQKEGLEIVQAMVDTSVRSAVGPVTTELRRLMSEHQWIFQLTPMDVAVDCLSNPTTLRIRLKVSKTDQSRAGVELYKGGALIMSSDGHVEVLVCKESGQWTPV